MAETIGTITNIKVASFLTGTNNPLDIGAITVNETATGQSWLFYLWISWADESLPPPQTQVSPAVQSVKRILQSQRLALAREAAFRKLTVHVFTGQESSSLVDELTVDIT